jgi:hypothetical protein
VIRNLCEFCAQSPCPQAKLIVRRNFRATASPKSIHYLSLGVIDSTGAGEWDGSLIVVGVIMRVRELFTAGLLYASICGPATASIITIDYTGTYSGTVTTGDPAISQFTTVQVDSTPFDLHFVFNTLTPYAYYTDTPSSSVLRSGFASSAGSASGTFFATGYEYAEDTATTGFTSQTIVDRTYSKMVSNTPYLYISVSHPDIPGSITQPFSISSGLTGTGSFHSEYLGNFSYSNESFVLSPETITVSVSDVPEPSTWAMLLIGFAGIGFAAYRRKFKAQNSSAHKKLSTR